MGEALTAAKDDPETSSEHISRCMRAHRAMAGHHEAIAEAHRDLDESHQDMADAHNALGRSIDGAMRCMRSVVAGSTTAAESTDGDSKTIQTSAGTQESDGSVSGRSLTRKERVEALAAVKH
jgi:hypothetical protein